MKTTTLRYLMPALILLLLIGPFINLYSQEKSTQKSEFDGVKNTLFIEFLGNGVLFSANYDVRLYNTFGVRAGIGYIFSTSGNGGIFTVPVTGNFLLGKNGKYFELGAGATYIGGKDNLLELENGYTVLGTLSLMYRRQPKDGGFMWKIGFTPFIGNEGFVPYWAGVALGYCW